MRKLRARDSKTHPWSHYYRGHPNDLKPQLLPPCPVSPTSATPQASGSETSSFYQMKPSSQPAPRSLGLPSAPSPVHGELGHKGDIMRPGGWWLMGQEGDMHTVHSELLLTELKAGVFLAKMCQGPLQLRESRGERRGLGQENKSPDQTRSNWSRGRQSVSMTREDGSLTCSASGGGGLGHPKSSLRSRFPSYSRKVRWRLRKNSTCLFFTCSFFGEFQWITCDPGGRQCGSGGKGPHLRPTVPTQPPAPTHFEVSCLRVAALSQRVV